MLDHRAAQPGPLEFGIFDWIEWRQQPASEIYEQRLKMIEYADRQDFFCYHLAEHHITPLSIAPSPGLFLSSAAQRTERIRLGPLVYLLPFYSPLRLLQEICMLDHLSRGRLELGVGRGIVPMEAKQYNVKEGEGRQMFQEALEVLIQGFTQDTLSYQGKHFSYEDVRLWLHPYQEPYPPLWYPSNNIETMPWIAQHGFNTCSVFVPNAGIKGQFDLYKQVWRQRREDESRLNRHVKEPKIGLTRHVYVAPTDEQAIEECRPAFSAWFSNINYLWNRAGSNQLAAVSDFDGLLEKEVIIAGSPQRVAEQLQRSVDECGGINYFCAIFAFGDLSHRQVMRSMELFVEEVMPAFR